MKAVIMAGGKGTRLRPLTCQMPKPMVPLIDRPCMEYSIDLLKEHGITEIAVTMQYMPDMIRNYFGDGSEFGVRLHYFEETRPLGTAGSVKNAASFLDERFIVISGDALTDFNLSEALVYHRNRQAWATLVLTRVSTPLEYGVVMTDEEGRIVRFMEKPSWGEVFSDTVNTGIYILEPDVLERIAPDTEFDFSNELFPGLLRDNKPLYGYVADGYWSDIGNLKQYRQTQFDMLDKKVKVRIKGTEIGPGLYVGDGVAIPPDFKPAGPAYIGDHTWIDEQVEIGPYCIIGSHNRLSRGSRLERTILWDSNELEEGCELDGSTLCSRISSRASARFSDGCVVGSHCVIGAKASIEPHVKIWPRKQVMDSSRLQSSLIWGEEAARSLFSSEGIIGGANTDITPEFAVRFASAYGAAVKANTLAVSCSPSPFARLVKKSIEAGLQAVTVNTLDLGEVSSAAARFAITLDRLDGGIHVAVRTTAAGRMVCVLECSDSSGLPISKSVERKVENSYRQEDYGRAALEKLGRGGLLTGAEERYLEQIRELAGLKCGAGQRPLRIILAGSQHHTGLLERMLESASCEWLRYGGADGRTRLPGLVPECRADLGLLLGEDGRSMTIVCEDGSVLDDHQLLAMRLMGLLYRQPLHRGVELGIPVSAPHALESLGLEHGIRLVRTREDTRSILERSRELPFHPLCDALFASGLIIGHLARSGQTARAMLQPIPDVHLIRELIPCPWDAKGKIMRVMMEQTKGEQVDLLDGIKFYHDKGWVLLLPDSDEPAFRIVAQGELEKDAAALASMYREQILNVLH